jgi:hypothetical protein
MHPAEMPAAPGVHQTIAASGPFAAASGRGAAAHLGARLCPTCGSGRRSACCSGRGSATARSMGV